jgi:putative transposase
MYQRYFDLYFTTATILNWKHLLHSDQMKDVIVDALRHLVQERKAVVYAFVVMPNHIHLIWHIPEPYILDEVKGTLLSFTAHQFKKILKVSNPLELEQYRVDLVDRIYQFWERNALSVAIYHDEVYFQKLQYLHWNPCAERWSLAQMPEAYRYSSAYLVNGNQFWDFVANE